MALTIGEARAVNDLLNYVLCRRREGGRHAPSVDEAQAAARLLAEHANKTLMAGIDGDDVESLWPIRRGGAS